MKTIKALRQEYGYSQKKLADLTGISQQSIANYENGKTTPPPEVLERIANVFAVSVDEIGNDDSDNERIFYVPRPDIDSREIGISAAYFRAWLEVNDITYTPQILNGEKGVNVIFDCFPQKESFFIRNSQFVRLKNELLHETYELVKDFSISAFLTKQMIVEKYEKLIAEGKSSNTIDSYYKHTMSTLDTIGEAERLSRLNMLNVIIDEVMKRKSDEDED